MKISKLEKSRIEFEVTISANDFSNYTELAAKELSKDLKIDGFRPGKAPRSVIEKILGKEKILAKGAEMAIKKSYVDFIVSQKIEAIGEPEITITKIAPGNSLSYKAIVAVMPEVIIEEFEDKIAKIKPHPKSVISPDKIKKEIDFLAKSRAKQITVNRPAQKGDRVEINFEGFIENKPLEGGKSMNHPLIIGENYFIRGFEDQLIGMSEGEKKEFELSFPENYHKKELAGKKATFKVKLLLVQEVQKPKIDDKFAKNIGKFSNLSELEKSIKEGLEMEEAKKIDNDWRVRVLKELISLSKIDVPDVLVEREIEKMVKELEYNVNSMGMDFDNYLTHLKKSREDLKRDWHNLAIERVKSALILKEIAKMKKIEPESKEIESEINKKLSMYRSVKEVNENFDFQAMYDYAKAVLTNEMVFDYLKKIANK